MIANTIYNAKPDPNIHKTPPRPHTHTHIHNFFLAPERYENQPAYCRSLCSPLPKKLKIKDSQNPLLLEYLERKRQMIEKQGINNWTNSMKWKDVNVCFSKHIFPLPPTKHNCLIHLHFFFCSHNASVWIFFS